MKSNSPIINIHENPFRSVSDALVKGLDTQARETGKEISREIFGTHYSDNDVKQAQNKEITTNSEKREKLVDELNSLKYREQADKVKSMVDLANPGKGNAQTKQVQANVTQNKTSTVPQQNSKVVTEHHQAAEQLGVKEENEEEQIRAKEKKEEEQKKIEIEQKQKESMENPIEAPGKTPNGPSLFNRKPKTRATRMLKKPPSAETRGATNRE